MKLVCLVAAAVLTLAACGSDGGDSVATDPGASSTPSPPKPPIPDGEVRTRDLATVLQDPEKAGPELCLGAIAESYPPMCGGLPIADWDWNEIGGGMHETQGETRWGSYAVTGTWDGTTFAATSAIPAALYDPAMPVEEPTPSPATAYDDEALDNIATQLGQQLPDALGTSAYDGHVLLDVVYDDGSLQQWADDAYGKDVVLVTSALVEVTR